MGAGRLIASTLHEVAAAGAGPSGPLSARSGARGSVAAAPPGGPIFNTVDVATAHEWPALVALIRDEPATRWVADTPPPVSPERWALRLGVEDFADGEDLARRIAAVLEGRGPSPVPAHVIVDELRGGRGTTMRRIADCAAWLRRERPRLDGGRWGVYLAHQDVAPFDELTPALDQLLAAGATIAVEMYANHRVYCDRGPTCNERDAWLADFFVGGRGSSPRPGFGWLERRRRVIGSRSRLTAVFGVTDAYLAGPAPAEFLDRMFLVWTTRTGFPEVISAANGGPGSYKWQRGHLDARLRGEAFTAAWDHYCRAGRTSPLVGPVPCDGR